MDFHELFFNLLLGLRRQEHDIFLGDGGPGDDRPNELDHLRPLHVVREVAEAYIVRSVLELELPLQVDGRAVRRHGRSGRSDGLQSRGQGEEVARGGVVGLVLVVDGGLVGHVLSGRRYFRNERAKNSRIARSKKFRACRHTKKIK